MHTSLPSVEEIWNWLDAVNDPEIPILSVLDLGIVRQVRWMEAGGDAILIVNVTPTYSGCPAIAAIKEDILTELKSRGLDRVRIETQLSPAWTTDWMSERGRKRLLQYGIAPPQAGRQHPSPTAAPGRCEQSASTVLACPRCGSTDTRLVSHFGSTPCKAFYICNSCREPFDHFKCH